MEKKREKRRIPDIIHWERKEGGKKTKFLRNHCRVKGKKRYYNLRLPEERKGRKK